MNEPAPVIKAGGHQYSPVVEHCLQPAVIAPGTLAGSGAGGAGATAIGAVAGVITGATFGVTVALGADTGAGAAITTGVGAGAATGAEVAGGGVENDGDEAVGWYTGTLATGATSGTEGAAAADFAAEVGVAATAGADIAPHTIKIRSSTRITAIAIANPPMR